MRAASAAGSAATASERRGAAASPGSGGRMLVLLQMVDEGAGDRGAVEVGLRGASPGVAEARAQGGVRDESPQTVGEADDVAGGDDEPRVVRTHEVRRLPG